MPTGVTATIEAMSLEKARQAYAWMLASTLSHGSHDATLIPESAGDSDIPRGGLIRKNADRRKPALQKIYWFFDE
jgi:hypothetical protein